MPALVIDASVARAAGGEQATYPASVFCRDCLLAVRDGGHDFVRTPEIMEEWKKHRSRFAATWLNSMIARKRVQVFSAGSDEALRQYPEKRLSSNLTEAFLKDCHLLEAAKASDKIVISLDDYIRALFRSASRSVRWVKTVTWANPAISDENVVAWIREGAPHETCRELGS